MPSEALLENSDGIELRPSALQATAPLNRQKIAEARDEALRELQSLVEGLGDKVGELQADFSALLTMNAGGGEE